MTETEHFLNYLDSEIEKQLRELKMKWHNQWLYDPTEIEGIEWKQCDYNVESNPLTLELTVTTHITITLKEDTLEWNDTYKTNKYNTEEIADLVTTKLNDFIYDKTIDEMDQYDEE